MKVQPGLKRVLLISFSTLIVAGLTYWYSRSWMRTAGEFGEQQHWLEKVAGPTHFLAALSFLIVLGVMVSQHIRIAIRGKRHRWTGWAFVGIMGGMMLTATGLLYLGNDGALKILGLVHPILGASLLPLLAFHWRGKASRSRD